MGPHRRRFFPMGFLPHRPMLSPSHRSCLGASQSSYSSSMYSRLLFNNFTLFACLHRSHRYGHPEAVLQTPLPAAECAARGQKFEESFLFQCGDVVVMTGYLPIINTRVPGPSFYTGARTGFTPSQGEALGTRRGKE